MLDREKGAKLGALLSAADQAQLQHPGLPNRAAHHRDRSMFCELLPSQPPDLVVPLAFLGAGAAFLAGALAGAFLAVLPNSAFTLTVVDMVPDFV